MQLNSPPLNLRSDSVVRYLPLCQNQTFVVPAANPTYSDVLVSDEIQGLASKVSAIDVHAFGTNFAPGFTWRVIGQVSLDGVVWTDFAGTGVTGSTANAYALSTFASITDGLRVRFKVQVTATTAGTSGTLSLVLALRLRT